MTSLLAANVERWCLDNLPPRPAPPHRAYGGPRHISRHNTRTRRHAVPYEAHIAATDGWGNTPTRPDAECGYLGHIDLGEWDPAHPDNCPACTTALTTTGVQSTCTPHPS